MLTIRLSFIAWFKEPSLIPSGLTPSRLLAPHFKIFLKMPRNVGLTDSWDEPAAYSLAGTYIFL